jgi:prevent-host-death family protein
MSADEVSVRELRQNLSVYLRRVRQGDTLAVTSRGERVAVLAPISGGSHLDRLLAEGRVSPPAVAGAADGLADPAPGPALTAAILADREDDER